VQRVVLAAVGDASERATPVYLIRLAAFLIILFAVVDKNRAPARAADPVATAAGPPDPPARRS
jgi:hypothetical protein